VDKAEGEDSKILSEGKSGMKLAPYQYIHVLDKNLSITRWVSIPEL
jgi:hypothetical protein